MEYRVPIKNDVFLYVVMKVARAKVMMNIT